MTELVLRLQFNYLSKLIDRIYKIIPLKEEKIQTVNSYIDSIMDEVMGNADLINSIDCDPRVMIIVSTLSSIKNTEEHDVYKRSVFKCIRYVEQLRDVVSEEISKCEMRGRSMISF